MNKFLGMGECTEVNNAYDILSEYHPVEGNKADFSVETTLRADGKIRMRPIGSWHNKSRNIILKLVLEPHYDGDEISHYQHDDLHLDKSIPSIGEFRLKRWKIEHFTSDGNNYIRDTLTWIHGIDTVELQNALYESQQSVADFIQNQPAGFRGQLGRSTEVFTDWTWIQRPYT